MKPKGKAGVVLTLLAGIGIFATIILASKKAPEAQKLKEKALEAKREQTNDPNAKLTKIEAIKAEAPCYAPVVVSAMATTGALIGSQLISQETINNLHNLHQTYKQVNAELNGSKAEEAIEDISNQKIAQVTDGIKKETFVLQFNGRDILFETTLLDVLKSEYEINRCFQLGPGNEVSVNLLLELFHVDDRLPNGDEIGWQQDIGAALYGYHWIDFTHRRGMLRGIPVTFIDMPFRCHSLNEDDCSNASPLW